MCRVYQDELSKSTRGAAATPQTQLYHSMADVPDTPGAAVAGMCACISAAEGRSKRTPGQRDHCRTAWHWVEGDAMMATSSDRADATEQIAASSTAQGAGKKARIMAR